MKYTSSIFFLFMTALLPVFGEIIYQQKFSDGTGGWSKLSYRDGIAIDFRAKITPGRYVARIEQIAVTPGDVLTFEAEVRIPRPLKQGVYRIGAAVFDQNGGVVSLITSVQSLRSAPEWTRLRHVFRVPFHGVKLQLRLIHNGEGEVQLRKVELRHPEKGSFERALVPAYAGTLEERKILHDWSLKSSGIAAPLASLDYEDKPEGSSYSIVFVRDNPFEKEASATVESIVEDDRPVPAPLREIERVTLLLKTFHAEGENFRLEVRFQEVHTGWGPMKNHHVAKIPLSEPGHWHRVELDAADFKPRPGRWGAPCWNSVDGMYFNLDFRGHGELGVKIADVTIHYRDGSTGKPFRAWRDPFWYFPKKTAEAKPLPELQWANVHGSGIYLLDSERGRKHFEELKMLLPNLAIQSNVYLRNLLAARPWLQKHGIRAGYQNASPYLWQAAVERDALAVPLESYEMLNEQHHKMDYTSERWNEIWREVATRFGRYGIPEYQTIDSNFRVVPEKVDRSLAAIRNERDGGIRLNTGETIHFWDYFRSYTGRRWRPADLAYDSWQEHRTVPVNLYAVGNSTPLLRKRGYLDMAIRHYCFIRFHNGASREFARNGVRFFLMNNGDDWRNGNDWIWNVRSLDRGGFVDENYFYHPRTVLKAHHLGLVHRKVFSGSGVHHRLIGESGKGGHGPIYWTPEFSYAALFAVCAATRYDSFEMDWPGEELLENLASTDDYQYDRFRDYLVKSLAYNHATVDDRLEELTPMNRVISLQETRAMYAGEHPRKMSIAAEKHSLPVSRVMPEVLDEEILSNASLIINDCYALPEGMAERLIHFVRSGPGRILLLHSASAGRKIDGTQWSEAFGWNRNSMNAPEMFGEILGSLRFKDGRTFAEKKGEVIFSDPGGTALSFYPQGDGGSGVYFYSHTPGIDPSRDVRILKAICRRHGIELPLLSSGTKLYVRGYRGRTGMVFTVFDKKSLDAWQWTYAATDNGLYPWRVSARKNEETIRVEPGKYRLFGMLSREEKNVTVAPNGALTLELRDVTAEVFHLLRADDQVSLEKIRQRRTELFQFPARRSR